MQKSSFHSHLLSWGYSSYLIWECWLPTGNTVATSQQDLASKVSITQDLVALSFSPVVSPHALPPTLMRYSGKLSNKSLKIIWNIWQLELKFNYRLMFNHRLTKYVPIFFWNYDQKGRKEYILCRWGNGGGEMPWSFGRPTWNGWLWFTRKKMKFMSSIHLAEMSHGVV